MADINSVANRACTVLASPQKEDCEANVRESAGTQECITKNKTGPSVDKCVARKMRGSLRGGESPIDAFASRGVPQVEIAKKIYRITEGNPSSETLSDAEAASIDEAFIKSTDKVTREVLAGMKPEMNTTHGKRIQSQAAAQLVLIDNDTSDAVKAKIDPSVLLDDVKTQLKGKGVDLEKKGGARGGFFVEGSVGLAASSATYRDNFSDADSIMSDNPINTGALNTGDKPEGNFPSQRLDLSLGYTWLRNAEQRFRGGFHFRKSAIEQGYEDPRFGRAVPDLKQISYMGFFGFEHFISPEFSVFGDLMVGVTDNEFTDSTGNLQNSTQSTQHGPLSKLDGTFLSGQGRGGVAYRVLPWLSVTGALSVYVDSTVAESTMPEGGVLNYGTTGVEFTGHVGLRFELSRLFGGEEK